MTLGWEHLGSWLTPYLTRVIETSDAFGPWAELLTAVVKDTLEGAPPELPVHLALEQRGLEGPSDLVAYLSHRSGADWCSPGPISGGRPRSWASEPGSGSVPSTSVP